MKQIIHVKPNSRKGPFIDELEDGSIVIYTREPAVDGLANQALIEQLSDYLRIPKTKLKIIRGLRSKTKIIEINE